MTEMPKVDRDTMLVGMVWIALVTAIVVLIIDWKIKNDILKHASEFYMTMGKEVPQSERAKQARPHPQPRHPDLVLPVPGVDSDTGMEAETLDSETHQANGRAAFTGNSDTGTTLNPGQVPSRTVSLERRDK